jgi:shikimate 5-dehydrogenase
MNVYSPATQPTLYFIGVTTTKSSIMNVFPAWAKHLELSNAVIKGIDFPLHAPAQAYRDVVEFIKHDPLSVGALITTHKIDLYKAAHDLFDVIDPHAKLMDETSCISKRKGKLICHAKDPISSGLSLDGFLPLNHFVKSGAEVFSIGAGGSTIALTWHLMQQNRGNNRPSRIIVSNRSAERLNDIKRIHREMNSTVPVIYVLAPNPTDNDAVVVQLKPGSLVINATGLGKDAPGSPLTNAASFPQNAIIWDLNYRGDLIFLNQARAQQEAKSLQIEDGWTYFIHGWTQVIAEVFDVTIPTHGSNFDALSHIAIGAAK